MNAVTLKSRAKQRVEGTACRTAGDEAGVEVVATSWTRESVGDVIPLPDCTPADSSCHEGVTDHACCGTPPSTLELIRPALLLGPLVAVGAGMLLEDLQVGAVELFAAVDAHGLGLGRLHGSSVGVDCNTCARGFGLLVLAVDTVFLGDRHVETFVRLVLVSSMVIMCVVFVEFGVGVVDVDFIMVLVRLMFERSFDERGVKQSQSHFSLTPQASGPWIYLTTRSFSCHFP